MPSKILNLYTDGESFIYSPKEITGFLMLYHNKPNNQIYYKFFSEELGENLIRIKEDKQHAMNIYNLFQKFLTEFGRIEVLNLSEFDEEDFEEETDLDLNEIEQFFGFQYYEDTDVEIIDSITNFYID